MNEPKYDGDSINYGFLKKYLKKYNLDETINSSNKGGTISKVYIVPPNIPYYKGTILIYDNKIYECISDRNIGNFNWNDWKVVAPNDSALNKFIEEIYDVDKLQFQNQLDGKVETFYQSDDPSMLWTTDLTKSKHVGDYWYNTVNNTQWRYSKNTSTTPITYSWLQVNIPNSVFDMINTKKSIYTSKPDKYKKNDLWIIEDTISEDDIPISETNPIKKGDWVFAIQDSEIYDKSHWVKRDESIDVDYLEDHYYTISDIDTKNNLIKEDYDSKIKKSKEDIYLEVSKSYVKETTYSKQISDYDKKIGTIENTVATTVNDISLIKFDNNKITSSVKSLEETVSGKDMYVLTTDITYQKNKEYYLLSENNVYTLLVEGTDYNVGNTIDSDIYEKTIIPGLEQEIDDNNLSLNKKIEEVKTKQTAQDFRIDIISTNIDSETGEVRRVTTENGYTFSKDGMKISSSEDNFNALHNNKGTYYKDGDTIKAQFTKDNTIIRDLIIYGKYFYGVNENLNVPSFSKSDAMFIAEKYVDAAGEECFGHFYNGGL